MEHRVFVYQVLMKRLTAIIQVQHPLHPSQTSDIVTDFKSKFAKYVLFDYTSSSYMYCHSLVVYVTCWVHVFGPMHMYP